MEQIKIEKHIKINGEKVLAEIRVILPDDKSISLMMNLINKNHVEEIIMKKQCMPRYLNDRIVDWRQGSKFKVSFECYLKEDETPSSS